MSVEKDVHGIQIPVFDLEKLVTEGKGNYRKRIKKIGKELSEKLSRIHQKIQLDEEFILWELSDGEIFWPNREFDDESFERLMLDFGEFSAQRIILTRRMKYPKHFYLYIDGCARMDSELRTFDETEIEYTFRVKGRSLKFKEVEVVGQVDHRFTTYLFKVSDEARLKTMLIGKAVLDLLGNFKMISDRPRKK